MAQTTEAQEVQQGVALLKFIADARPGDEGPYLLALREAVEESVKRLEGDEAVGWFYHDVFSTYSEPIYFHHFMADATRQGLQFLSEADLPWRHEDEYGPAASAALNALGDDVVAREQYLDFLSCKRFRATLLCRADVPLARTLEPVRVRRLYVTGDLRPENEEATAGSDAPAEFAGHAGRKTTVSAPLLKAAFQRLARTWPAAVSVEDLVSTEAPGVDVPARPVAEGQLCQALLAAYSNGLVELLTRAPAVATEIGERPVASALARLQIAEGPRVTTLRHREVLLQGAPMQRLLQLLDGRNDREDLRRELCALAASTPDDGSGARLTPDEVEAGLDGSLRMLVRLELLVA